MTRVFIDGSAGTTGLRIHDRLCGRTDIALIELAESERKSPEKRRQALNDCDLAILCLPDLASVESVSFIENPAVRVIDTSTAHRTAPDWVYGFPELSEPRREAIAHGARVAAAGCHASGFISLVYPLVEAGALSKDALLSCHSVTGYSGGGKSMIAQYESEGRVAALDSPRQYGIAQMHKHLPEMRQVCGLENAPVFSPIVADYYCGMSVTVPLFKKQLSAGADIGVLREIYARKYAGPVVRYTESMDEAGFIAANTPAGKDGMEISVFGCDERILLVSRFDNLGKGASGGAVQCMNIMLGLPETTGLSL